MSHSVKCLGYMLEGVKMINDDKCIMMIVADVKNHQREAEETQHPEKTTASNNHNISQKDMCKN